MTARPNSTPREDAEIDLIELLVSGISAVRANFWWIVLFVVSGAALGIAFFFSKQKEYESKMIISSNILTTSYAKVLFDNANGHLADGDHELLGKDLQMSADEIKLISSLAIENVSKGDGTELKESERYLITAHVFDQKILPSLQNGIITYLENNDFVKVRVEQNRKMLTQMKAAVEEELKDVQSFKNDVYSGKFFNNAKGNVMFDPTGVNTKVLELTQRKIDYENALQLSNSVQLIEGFSAFKHYVRPRLNVSILAGVVFGLFAAGAFMTIKGMRRLLETAEAKRTKNAA